MITASAKISESSKAACLARLKKAVTARQEKIALRLYEYILAQDTPIWSGAFDSSWRINSGVVDTSHEIAPTQANYHGTVFRGSPRINQIYHPSYTLPIFISNSVENQKGVKYAGMIEDYGSPTHNEPWKIATSSVNLLMLSKFSV